MKPPIFTEYQRRSMYYPELEIAKLKFKREFQKSNLWILVEKIAKWLFKLYLLRQIGKDRLEAMSKLGIEASKAGESLRKKMLKHD